MRSSRRQRRRPLQERFWEKVNKTDTCWLWTGATHSAGYGVINMCGGGEKSRLGYAHRLSYEWLVGPIPSGLHIDHLCRVRNCVRPDHLEPVTMEENIRRGAPNPRGLGHSSQACPKGHPYSGENLYRTPKGFRNCRACRREQARACSLRTRPPKGTLSPADINRAKTHCIRGHSLSGANLFTDRKGHRGCRTCRKATMERFQARRRGEAA